MSLIIEPTRLRSFLDFEERESKVALQHWQPEFEAACELSDIFQMFTAALKVGDTKARLPARLLLVVESQLYGVCSELLRRRLTDAMMGARRAVEASGMAYRVWENEELVEVFFNAYPYVEQDGHTKQWKASRAYRDEFKTAKLFGGEGETWHALRVAYQMLSAMSSHASPGALKDQEMRQEQYFAHFVETNDKEIRRAWYFTMATFLSILKVFLHLLRSELKDGMSGALEAQTVTWRNKINTQMDHRCPWLAAKTDEQRSSSLLVSPNQMRFLWRGHKDS